MKRLGWLILLFGLNACSQQDTTADLSAEVAHLQQQVPREVSLVSAFHFRADTRFNGQWVHSPFPQSSDSMNSALLSVPPLQRYSLDVLHLLGIVEQGLKTFAVIQTPDSKIYQVQQGDLMGNHYGRITAISAYDLTLIEPANPVSGITSPHTVILHLKAS